MNCPRCDSPLDDANARFCPICGANIVQPPEPEPTPAQPAPPAASPAAPQPASGPTSGAAHPGAPAGAYCAVHPEKLAVDICSRCGGFACGSCLVVGADGQGICQSCFAREGGETVPLPWEKRKELGFFNAYWETTKKIMFQPNTAFDRVIPETGQWWDPLSYAIFSNFIATFWILIIYGIAGGAGLIGAMTKSDSSNMSVGLVAGIAVGVVFACIIFVPLMATMTVFIGGGIEHLCLKLIGVPTRGFEATVRAYCYGQAPMFWGVVPICGMYVYPIWALVCRIFAYKSMHKTTGGKAAAGALLPTILCCGIGGVFYAIAIAASIASNH
jgi:hypothetical protein